MSVDLYAILGLTRDADTKAIRTAYRTLAKKFHPDVAPGYEEKFAEIQEAHDVLTDDDERAFYDQTGTVRGRKAEGVDQAQVLNFTSSLLSHAMLEIEGTSQSLTKKMGLLLQQQRIEVKRQIGAREAEKKKLAKIAARIKAKPDQENVLGKLLQNQIKEIDSGIANANANLEMMDKVAKLIDGHDYEPDPDSASQEAVRRSRYDIPFTGFSNI